MRVSELISALKVQPSERGQIRRILDHLIQEGVIVRIRKDRLVLPSEADLVTGLIQMNPRGFGFVTPESSTHADPSVGDIFIPAEDTSVAMHGDRVVIRIHTALKNKNRDSSNSRGVTSKSKCCGQVIRILERANSILIGTLQKSRQFYYVAPDDPRIARDIYVHLNQSHLKPKNGDRVVVKLIAWENRHINPEGVIQEILGRSDDPKIDIPVIIKKFRFRTDFPKEVLEQTENIDEHISSSERQQRMDFSQDLVVTIDPENAQDHDDAVSLKQLPSGHWLLGVHIADVSHYIKPGTPLDREARERGNSVYLPDRVIPMLPPRLSNNLCSLKEKVDRLTRSVLFEIHPHGNILSYSFRDTIIRSAAKLTYQQVLSIIQPSSSLPQKNIPIPIQNPEILRLLKDLWSLASKVRFHRFAHGSLDLDFPELKIYCAPDGTPERIEKRENDISHQLIEEFMLLANEAVAAETGRHTIPSIYRIHEDPDPEKLEEYRDIVISNGHSMGDPTVRGEIQKLLKRIAGKPEEYILKLNLLRSLKRAQYSTRSIGHYGLAKENYTHFTSPIRRYADLIVHRSLPRTSHLSTKSQTKKIRPEMAYDIATLETIVQHCSITERTADEAEREAIRLKLIEYFELQLKKHRLDSFDALVTDVRNFGLWIELPEFMLSGLIHVSTLNDDFYSFDPVRQKLTGKRTRRVFQAGDKLHVAVARIDRLKKQVDFQLSE